MDATLTALINGLGGRLPALDLAATLLAGWGVQVMMLMVVASWWLRDARLQQRHLAISAGLAVLLGETLNQAVLLVVQRPRPYATGITHLMVPASADWSFPSDHATAATAIAAVFLMKGARLQGGGLAVLGLLVAVSRVFVGLHYLGDILGGAATGLLATASVNWLWREGNAIEARLVRVL